MAIVITSDTLTPALDEFDARAQEAIRQVMEYWAARSVSQMRTNARWTDRTSNARNGLSSQVYVEPDKATLVLFHAMPYGIWLEVRWSGRYAIIGPTLNAVAPDILRMVGNTIMRLAVP